ncbi:MAG: DMT family transporter [Acidobacteria bacterium]|nr:DMT family transporter [Acidobacteriota bacterium]
MARGDGAFTAFFLIVPVSWAGSFIAGKYVVQSLDPVESTFLRFLLSALAMFPGLLLFHRRRHPDFRERGFLKHLGLGVLTAGLGYHLLFFWGLKLATPTNASLLIALNPFFTALGEVAFFHHRRPGRFYAGFALAFAGAAGVIVSRGGVPRLDNLGAGELICLAAAVTWSVYTLLARSTKAPHWDALWINAYSYLVTALLLVPFCTGLLGPAALGAVPAEAWWGTLYMAVFPTAIGYTLFYVGVQRKGGAWAAAFSYLVPSLTALLDHLFFHAAVTAPMAVGTALVVGGLLLGNLPSRPPLKPGLSTTNHTNSH